MRNFKALLLTLFFGAAPLFQPVCQSSRPVVDMISATPVSTNKIKISWKLPKDSQAQSICIFKNTMPLTSKIIEQTKPCAQISPKLSSYTDTVINYREYYYAVICRLEDGSLYNIILPSVNATVKGVKVARTAKKTEPSEEQKAASTPKVYPKGNLRELPLPYIDLVKDIEKKPNPLKKEVLKAGEELAAGYSERPKEKLSPYYFDADIVSPAGGDDYFLFEILRNYFVKKDYKNSAKELKKFLSVNRSEDTTNRAMFYLAQSQYFAGNYRSALTMFLVVEDAYPVLSKKWINSTLDFYEIPEN